MKLSSSPRLRSVFIGVSAMLALSQAGLFGEQKRPNPASKLYVTDVSGDADIDTGDSVDDLSKRSVYTAQGTVIQTKKPSSPDDKTPHYTTMVYSNGTGAFFDEDTRVEIKKFSQEPFVPARSDNDVEPSISQTQAFVPRGTVGLCTSKLVAGSSMSYATPHGSVNIRGQKVVIQAEADVTRVSMLEGESTVRAGASDMGGHTVHVGEQAIIRSGGPGQPDIIQIQKIPQSEAAKLDEKVSLACMAKKTVYFEVKSRRTNSNNSGSGEVSAFDTDTSTPRSAGFGLPGGNLEIVAIPVTPVHLPVEYVTSPASLILPNGKTVTPGNGTPTPGASSPGG